MDRLHKPTQSFIIRIWLEDDGDVLWRGHITHVPSGHKESIQDDQDIFKFISGYLNEIGVAQTPYKRIKQSIKKWKLRLQKLRYRH